MPAVEATGGNERELISYELAFHVLPTMAEGEVTRVFEDIKAFITKVGGEVTLEEAPARFDLAYEIVKYLEGRNRKFSSAYFGWVRFKVEGSSIAAITEEVEGTKELLRFLLIKLTKTEEAQPFFFHEALATRTVETIVLEDEEVVEEVAEVVEDEVVEGGEVAVDKV